MTLIAGNWKMFKGPSDTADFCRARRDADLGGVDAVVAPPFVSLADAVQALAGTEIGVFAQNCHWDGEGAFTGEVSPPMLKEISQAVEQAKLTANSGRMGGNAFANVLGDLVETNKTASPELVQAKLELFRRRYCEKDPAKRYTAEQFHQGLDYFESLDRKFSPRTRTGTVSDARTRAAEGSKHHE